MAATIGFRPTDEDERIIRAAMREGERTSDVIRRALRLLEHEVWLAQAREENPSLLNRRDAEPWERPAVASERAATATDGTVSRG